MTCKKWQTKAGHDLNEVNPAAVGGAKTTIDDVHAKYTEDMNSLARLLRQELGYKDTDPEAVRIEKVIAKTALKKGKEQSQELCHKEGFRGSSQDCWEIPRR